MRIPAQSGQNSLGEIYLIGLGKKHGGQEIVCERLWHKLQGASLGSVLTFQNKVVHFTAFHCQ